MVMMKIVHVAAKTQSSQARATLKAVSITYCSIFRLRCHSGSSAASQDSLCCCCCCCVVVLLQPNQLLQFVF